MRIGNHDRFGSESHRRKLERHAQFDLLDGAVATRDGLRIGGVSYIIGNPAKPGRADQSEFLAAVEMVAEERPDIVVLHQGPPGARSQRGEALVREVLERADLSLVVCGHVHWGDPLAALSCGTQVVNVDARVIIVTR